MSITNHKKELLINELVVDLPEIRRKLGLSQTDFGNEVGLSRQTISSIERGTSDLTWNNYLALMMYIHSQNDKFDLDFFETKYDEMVNILTDSNNRA